MQQFQITLKNTKVKSYYVFAWLIAAIFYSIEIYFVLFDVSKKSDRIWVIPILGINLLLLFISSRIKWDNWKRKEYVGLTYGFLLVPLIKWGSYWPAVILIISFILLSIASRKFIVSFSDKNIVFPSFPARKISWNEGANCLLKDEIRTIEFKNNKMIQEHIEPGKDPVNEKEFNDFCIRQLTSGNQKKTT